MFCNSFLYINGEVPSGLFHVKGCILHSAEVVIVLFMISLIIAFRIFSTILAVNSLNVGSTSSLLLMLVCFSS